MRFAVNDNEKAGAINSLLDVYGKKIVEIFTSLKLDTVNYWELCTLFSKIFVCATYVY